MALQLDHYRLLGNSGLRVSPLCLGTMTFGEEWGWGSNPQISGQIFASYLEQGGNFIDTADLYTGGTSEKYVGEFARGRRDRLVIATKFSFNEGSFDKTRRADPNAGGNARKHMRSALEGSLERLGTDYIDLYWVHAWDGLTPIEETMRALDDLVRQGKVLYVGVSNYPAWTVARADTLAALRGWSPLIGIQIEYSLVERAPERELLSMARDLGIGVVPWSPLAQGALTGKFLDQPPEAGSRIAQNPQRAGGKYSSQRAQGCARACVALAREKGVTAGQVAIAWLLHQPGVTSPILGARTPQQFTDNLGALRVDLSAQELAQLDEASRIDLGYPHDFLLAADPMITGNTRIQPPPQGRLV